MSDAYLLSGCRTPIGRFGGLLSSLSAPELGAAVVRESLVRASVDPATVDEVILGNVLTAGVGQAPARQAALHAGLPPTVAALTVNKVCGSGLKAVMLAAQAIRSADANIVVAGGMESMSQAAWVLPRNGPPLGDRTLVDSLMHDGLRCAFCEEPMGEIAERLADRMGISREDQDRYACESHDRAIAASDVFRREIHPIPVTTRSRKSLVEHDEGPRPDTNLERLAMLPAVFRQEGTVTAGNASMISDGAAALVVASSAAAARIDTTRRARIVATATAGTEPQDLFLAPVAAIQMVLEKAGCRADDVDLFEINEAFAVQMLACLQQLELPPDRVNVGGGAIALGHPIGASGARVLVTLLHALEARNGRIGVAALCLGGGNAVAMLIDREVG